MRYFRYKRRMKTFLLALALPLLLATSAQAASFPALMEKTLREGAELKSNFTDSKYLARVDGDQVAYFTVYLDGEKVIARTAVAMDADIVTLPDLRKKYIDTGKVRLILREFAWDPRAEAAFMLARCSKDKYFAMVDVLFHQQDNWARADDAKGALLQISKLAGFTQETFNACLTDQKLLDDIRAVKKRGEKDFGVDATPTFFINGKKYPGAMSIEEMSAIIDPLI